jgi:hypothetical protein
MAQVPMTQQIFLLALLLFEDTMQRIPDPSVYSHGADVPRGDMYFRQSPSVPNSPGRFIRPRPGVRWSVVTACFLRVLVPAGVAAVRRLYVLSIAPIAHQLDAPFGSTFVV